MKSLLWIDEVCTALVAFGAAGLFLQARSSSASLAG
jgi:hypothetical protein